MYIYIYNFSHGHAPNIFLQCQQATAEAQERSSKRSRMLPSGPEMKKMGFNGFDSKGLLNEKPNKSENLISSIFGDGLGVLLYIFYLHPD